MRMALHGLAAIHEHNVIHRYGSKLGLGLGLGLGFMDGG